MNTTNKLRSVRDDVIQCRLCDLYKTRINPVIGEGNHDADIMIIGEAPGEMESKQGKPFIGPAGKVLDKMLASINLDRKDIYICNTLKCRPPDNSAPTEEQKFSCLPYLTRQIEAIKPKVLVCLGNHATKSMLNLFGHEDKVKGISKIHGKVFDVDLSFQLDDLKILPMYHPAAVLHNPPIIGFLRQDFNILKNLI